MCFRTLEFSEADLCSLFSNSGIVTSPLNLVAFLVIEFLALGVQAPALDIFLLCASGSDRALLLLF